MLVAAGLAGARDHALISLHTLNGLRVSEAVGADNEQLGLERGHRTPGDPPKGRQDRHHPPRTTHHAPPISLLENAATDRSSATVPEYVSIATALHALSDEIARKSGITERVGPHTLRHAFITAALDAGGLSS